jgi:HD superfamily phosphohydrolase
MQPVASFRDPIHGFVHADPLEKALIDSRPLQRLRSIRQLGFAYLVFPGAEHSRFGHALGAMELAGRVYDAVAVRSEGILDPDRHSQSRRLVRAAALLHDIGHAPFSHSAEELFEGGINHEQMTRRLLGSEEIARVFDRWGEGLAPTAVARLLAGPEGARERLLSQIVSGELDVDKMDYLLRDSLFCGVRYGSYDLARLLDTMLPLRDPETNEWGLGVFEGGVHALEALVMARYYMFTQVYFNPIGKALELHFNEWLEETGHRWPSDPEAFLAESDFSIITAMGKSDSPHARAVTDRQYYPMVFETREHLSSEDKARFEILLPTLRKQFGHHQILVSRSAKDPHRLGEARVLVKRFDGGLEPMEEASHFIRHLARIDRYRIYTPPEAEDQVSAAFETLWNRPDDPDT